MTGGPPQQPDRPSGQDVTIVGGGLAGLAAAVVLADSGMSVRLLEARNRLGGRASSFSDPRSGELVDFCQHVSMGCCSQLLDFCRRVNIADQFERVSTIRFADRSGRRYDLQAHAWLPAPFHLAPAMWRMKFLRWTDRLRIGYGLWRLLRLPERKRRRWPHLAAWLADHGQTPAAIDDFWSVVLTSALAESLDRISVEAGRQVLVEGFLANRRAYELLIPTVPLGELYGDRLLDSLRTRGVEIELGRPVRQISPGWQIACADGQVYTSDYIVLATPWRQAARLVAGELLDQLPELREAANLTSSAITGVHLWLDRPITDEPHLALIGRASQWLFYRGLATAADHGQRYYYQVVISNSDHLVGQSHQLIIAQVLDDLQAVCPAAREAVLLDSQVATERAAAFSPSLENEQRRPAQTTVFGTLALAGDWTATGWPATMEGAVRSGYLAAFGFGI